MLRPHSWNLFRLFSRKVATDSRRLGIVGVPFEKGQPKPGVQDGPDHIRGIGIIKDLEDIGLEVTDYGNINYENTKTACIKNMKNLGDVAACTKVLSGKVQHIIRGGETCLILGGDHSIAIGSIDGHVTSLESDDDIAVLWVDAHPDLNTNASSCTGNIHGMALAMLCKELTDVWPYLPGMDWRKPRVSMKNIAYVGLRSVDSYERELIKKYGITAFGMHDIEKYGIFEVAERALEAINPHSNRSLHVSFDIDSIDSLEAPSTGTPVRGGLTLREGISLLEIVHNTNTLKALDFVEVNPCLGSTEDSTRTLEATKHLIKAAFGYSR
ncbi:arginase-1 [Ischnura elegans]|uniref:arginase-1 n=1 Tax=Ischnura elegans TaxID=197161 RepID=UPI001ED87F1C|nr:arginase-1 [Ischnura elegans]